MLRSFLVGLVCLFTFQLANSQDQSQQHASQSEQPIKMGPGVQAPRPINTPEASLPDAARDKQTGATCLVSLMVDSKGMPQDIHVVRCSDAIFEKNSVDAVKQYRFKPAVYAGKPVAITINIQVTFRVGGSADPEHKPPTQIEYSFLSPPGTTSGDPDANGVYPLSKRLEPPTLTRFVSNGFGKAAMFFPNGTSCRVVLVIDQKGKPSNASISQCDKPTLERPAIEALMASKYRPARLNGLAVPVRTTVYLMYEGFGPHDTNHEASSSTP